MTEEQSNSEPTSGFPHPLTPEERLRGAMASTPKKTLAARLNPVRSGRYAKASSGDFLNCDRCSLRAACAFSRSGAGCSIATLETYKGLAQLWKSDASDFMKQISRSLMQLNLSIKREGDDPRLLTNYVALLAKIFELRFGTLAKTASVSTEQVVLTYKRPDWLGVPDQRTEEQAIEAATDSEWLEQRMEWHQKCVAQARERIEKIKN